MVKQRRDAKSSSVTRGGKRDGAGRPRTRGATVRRVPVELDLEEAARLERLQEIRGGETASEVMRAGLEALEREAEYEE
jgi:hypothetical protein